MALVGTLGAYFIAGALGATPTSIQYNNVFELDGNATHGNGTSAGYPVPNSHDWDQVYCTANPGATGCSNVGSDGANVRSFDTDPVNSNTTDNIYTGGSTKDGLPISGWLWKTGAPQAKDDLEHAYAAEYNDTTPLVCTTFSGSPLTLSGCVNHQLLFFGTDRYSNSGDSDVGFWFFKGKVSPGNTASGGGFKFVGNHTDGDVLVLSTFQNGGVVPQVAVYKWSCPGATSPANCDSTGSLTLLSPSLNSADCQNGVDTHGNPVPATTGDFCATVNSANHTPSPWPYTEKASDGSYVTANQFGGGTFLEGGLDLTNLGLANSCFSSFLAESRSSQATTATLSDFDFGQFGVCSASITTSHSGAATVTPGAQVTDTATVTGSGLANPPFPTSSTTTGDPGAPGTPVTFGYCFSTTSISSCSGLTVNSLGTANLSPTTTQGKSSATSTAIDTTGKTPGYYCFTASWGGDANYPGTISDNGSVGSECFQVLQIGTTTVTTPSDSSGTALSGSQAFDTTIYDKAVVTANQSGEGRPTGTVSFWVCDPAHTTTDTTGTYCASGDGTAVTGNPVTLTADSSNTLASDALSGGVKADAAGTWCFRATYTPDTTAFTSSSENNPTGECVVVSKAATTTKTTPVDSSGKPLSSTVTLTDTGGVTVADTALITGVVDGGNPTGTVDFSICGPVSTGTCDASSTSSTGYSLFDVGEAVGNFGTDSQGRPTGTATSTGVVITTVGTYCFYAKYNSTNGNYNGSDDPNDSAECFIVKDTSITVTAQNWLPNDSATFTTAGGNKLNGTVSFSLFSDGTCGADNGTDIYDEPTITLTNASSGTTEHTTNTDVKVTATQTVSWLVQFTSTDSNVKSSSHCEVTSLTISNG